MPAGRLIEYIYADVQLTINDGNFGNNYHNGATTGATLEPNPQTYAYLIQFIPIDSLGEAMVDNTTTVMVVDSVDTTIVKTEQPLQFLKDATYRVYIYGYDGKRWRWGSATNEWTATWTATLSTSYSTKVVRQGDDLLKNHYLTSPYTFDIYEDVYIPASEEDFQNTYSLGLQFLELADDANHSTDWANHYNANTTGYWVNGKDWVLKWLNFTDNTYNNNKELSPDVDLLWLMVPEEEDFGPDNPTAFLYRNGMVREAGFTASFRQYLNSGENYTYGTEDKNSGVFVIHLFDILHQLDFTKPRKDKGYFYLYFLMTYVNEDAGKRYSHKLAQYKVHYEKVAATGSLSIISVEDYGNRMNLYLNEWPGTGEIASRVITNYTVNSVAHEAWGKTSPVEITGIQPHSLVDISVSRAYMNQTGVDVSNTVTWSDRAAPRLDDVTVSITPTLVGDTLEYSITFTVDTSSNADNTLLNYAYFREEPGISGRDYHTLQLSTSSINTSYHSGTTSNFLVPDTTVTFTGLSEDDIEQFTWIVLVEGTNGKRHWSVLRLSKQTIQGTSGQEDAGLGSPHELSIPKETSVVYGKEITVADITLGQVNFKPALVFSKDYKLTKPLATVGIEVEDYIPPTFSGSYNDYIQYAIIIEGKQYPIQPLNRATGDGQPKLYHINMSIPESLKAYREQMGEAFIETEKPVTQLTVQVQLTGDSNTPQDTPVVYSWNIIAITGQERLQLI